MKTWWCKNDTHGLNTSLFSSSSDRELMALYPNAYCSGLNIAPLLVLSSIEEKY